MNPKLITCLLFLMFFNLKIFAQQLNWAKHAGGTGHDEPNAMITDGSGNIYIAGGFNGTMDADPGIGVAPLTSFANSTDIFFAKYDASGNYLWAKALIGTGDNSNTDMATDIALDAAGNIYITGSIDNAVDFDPGAGTAMISPVNYSQNYFFAKYDPSGNYLWAKTFGKKYYSNDIIKMALDASGNIYLSGYIMGSPAVTSDFDPGPGVANLTNFGLKDAFLAKYDPYGNYLWVKKFGSPGAQTQSFATVVDSHGNVLIGGITNNIVDFDPSMGVALINGGGGNSFFAKYDSMGALIWVKSFEGGGNGIRTIVLDNTDNVYVGGVFTDVVDFDADTAVHSLTCSVASQINNYFAKYDASGNYVFAQMLPEGNGAGLGIAGMGPVLALDPSQNICISGVFRGTEDFDPGVGITILSSANSAIPDCFFGKYDNTGGFIWAANLVGNSSNAVCGISANSAGQICIAGTFTSTTDFDPTSATTNLVSSGGSDFFMASYTGPASSALAAPTNLTATVFKTDASYVLLSWTDNSTNETGFKIERSDDGISYTYLDATPGTSIFDYSVLPGAIYYYRVYAYNANTNSAYSNVVQANLVNTGITDINNVSINLYPNPVSNMLNIENLTGKTEIKITDMRGRGLIHQSESNAKHQVDLSSFSKGTYLVQITSGNTNIYRKIVVE